MYRSNKKSGFTLIEIIVVLIIVGVLAAIALPNLFGQVERNRAQEALSTNGSLKEGVESCIVMNQNTWNANCTGLVTVGVTIPAGALFGYAITSGTAAGAANTATTYVITATRAGIAANTVTFTRNANGSITCAGGGAYVGVCV